VFDEAEQRFTTMSLFPDDREIPSDAIDSIQVRLSGLELRRPRVFGNCWLACELWQQLGLDEFWQVRLAGGRETVSWEKVLRLLAVNRLLDPGSEFRVHRQWYVDSAMDELLEKSSQTRSTAAAHRRGEERSGTGFQLREDPASGQGPARHALDLHVSYRQSEAQGRSAARRPLSAAQQSHW